MPARPMYRSPHKRVNGWAKGYVPEFSKRTHAHNNGVRKDRNQPTEPMGRPQGKHADTTNIQRLGLTDCFCGGCFQKNNGYERFVRG